MAQEGRIRISGRPPSFAQHPVLAGKRCAIRRVDIEIHAPKGFVGCAARYFNHDSGKPVSLGNGLKMIRVGGAQIADSAAVVAAKDFYRVVVIHGAKDDADFHQAFVNEA